MFGVMRKTYSFVWPVQSASSYMNYEVRRSEEDEPRDVSRDVIDSINVECTFAGSWQCAPWSDHSLFLEKEKLLMFMRYASFTI